MSIKHKLVSIVIVNYNGKEDTLNFLRSLEKTDYPNFEIIVVDNASADDSVEAIRKRFPHVRVIRNKLNLGYSGGLNSGIAHSRGKYIVGLVNDIIAFQKEWLTEVVKVAESDEKIGMVASIWVRREDRERLQQRVHLMLGRVSEKMLELLGSEFFGFGMIERGEKPGDLPDVLDIRWGNGLIKRDVLRKVGVFDGKMFMNYEANDLGYRMRKAGYRVVLATRSRLQHAGLASIKRQSHYFADYHFYRGKIRFVLKNYDLPTKAFALSVELPYFMLLMVKHALSGRPESSRAIRDAIVWNIANWRDYMPVARRRHAS
ncbi:MAG: glycosyltransferase family 2 protein [Candidatus Aenigmarchaeota archaeon]|nr:glycosyltransferase family 2 protein [Candidatus Aenigmarchaeota archaeon]